MNFTHTINHKYAFVEGDACLSLFNMEQLEKTNQGFDEFVLQGYVVK